MTARGKRKLVIVVWTLGAATLAGCMEREQTIGTSVRVDQHASQGTGTQFAAPGWKQGDRVSWESQLKTRTQNGQNDYTRVN